MHSFYEDKCRVSESEVMWDLQVFVQGIYSLPVWGEKSRWLVVHAVHISLQNFSSKWMLLYSFTSPVLFLTSIPISRAFSSEPALIADGNTNREHDEFLLFQHKRLNPSTGLRLSHARNKSFPMMKDSPGNPLGCSPDEKQDRFEVGNGE